MKPYFILSLIVAASLLTACTKGGSDDSDSGGGGGNPGDVHTECGVVVGGKLRNPVDLSEGEKGVIKSVSSGNVMIVTINGQDRLIRLLGIDEISYGMQEVAKGFVQQDAGGEITFFPATNACTVPVPGGAAEGGMIITGHGTSLGEDLLQRGYVQSVDSGGTCGEELVSSCYQALREMAPDVLGTIRDFLWKPASEGGISPGKLVVLVDACNADVVVNGEHLKYDGPSNGRCSLGRSTKPGCAYGSNIKVEVFDLNGRGVYAFPDGKLYYTVNNGCTRQEFR